MRNGGKTVNMVAMWLVIIGGVNWGLVGLFDWNLVTAIFGGWGWLVDLIYILVGLAALWLIPAALSKK